MLKGEESGNKRVKNKTEQVGSHLVNVRANDSKAKFFTLAYNTFKAGVLLTTSKQPSWESLEDHIKNF